ncbi:carboxy terminal-processing peptidase [Psittacicella hinzii]|uniref:PDZ domain-containing protein n=1 Tax=Psittacicella hinzii TaxID=2028575 RepID=A0A3A1YWL6_9GAMM|nr:carboxy terminal-processing peptidase [Psittacicella hinzii]RIY40447.1 hypothetical protein CKF58_00585 [Psittacicella hinzii]
MKTKLILTAIFAGLSSASFMLMPQAANAVLVSKTKSPAIDTNKYLRNSVMSNFVLNTNISGDSFKPDNEFQYPFRQIPGIYANNHFLHQRLNEGEPLARKVLEQYLRVLDPGKVLFTKQEVENLYKTYTTGNHPLITNNLDTGWKIYQLYARHLTELNRLVAEYVLSLNSEPNLDTDMTITKGDYAEFRDEGVTLADVAKKYALRSLIAVKIDKPKFDWNQVRAYVMRGLIYQQNTLNNTRSVDVYGKFVDSLVKGGADAHSAFYPPEDSNTMAEHLSSSFYGIGVGITANSDGTFVIASIIKGGPSEKQGGIEKDDEILAVSQDGKNWVNADTLLMPSLIKLIKGKENTKVFLRLYSKDGFTKVVSINRGAVKQEDIVVNLKKYTKDGKEYGVVKFGSFYQGLSNDLYKALSSNPNLEGLIIDLRGNTGGYVEEAQGISSIFLDQFSPIMQVTNNRTQVVGSTRNSRPVSFSAKPYLFNKPIIVLIDAGSASASEIFSGAVQDYRRGLIMGDKSFGKGTVQAPINISDFTNDGLTYVTIQIFFRVTGKTTQVNGVTPDIQLPILTLNKREVDFFNALKPETINAAKYTPYNNFVSKNILTQLTNVQQEWSKTHPDYSKYVSFINRIKTENDRKFEYVNYTKRLEFQKYYQGQILQNYNKWAKENNKPSYSSYEELMKRNIGDKDGPDLALDMSKDLLVEYVKLWNQKK